MAIKMKGVKHKPSEVPGLKKAQDGVKDTKRRKTSVTGLLKRGVD